MEVPRFRQDSHVAGMAMHGSARIGWRRNIAFVDGRPEFVFRQTLEFLRAIDQSLGDEMDDALGAALDLPVDKKEA